MIKNNEIVVEVPKEKIKRIKCTTIRFTEEEKETIDNTVVKYNTTITELMRKAVFYYISVLNNDNDILKTTILKNEFRKIYHLKKALDQIEIQLNLVKNEISGFGLKEEQIEQFLNESNNMEAKD